ncbi:Fatty acyl-CoA reductase [Sergentomyia squamirostris]
MNSKDLPIISEFFRNREIFITGGTGFLGKALIEKIRYSCPDVKKIYLLLRSKRRVSVSDRLDQLKTCQIFNRIRQKDENLLEKLVPLEGNSMSLKLGLSDHDLKRLENVSVIIDSAASVRFDDPLHKAILLNTRSAREVCLIAENLKNLKVLAHISTTYCNLKNSVIEEKVYPLLADWRQAIKLAENLDPDVLDILAPKYMDYQPNAHTFTKSLAEQIMIEYSQKLPIFIFRPSIVAPSVKEPLLGWVDNFNGITGLLVGQGTGLIRIAFTSLNIHSNFQPLDVVTRSLIIAIWKQGCSPSSSEAIVYNCACSQAKEAIAHEIFQLYLQTFPKVPFDEIVWVSKGRITSSYVIYKIFLLLQVIFDR